MTEQLPAEITRSDQLADIAVALDDVAQEIGRLRRNRRIPAERKAVQVAAQMRIREGLLRTRSHVAGEINRGGRTAQDTTAHEFHPTTDHLAILMLYQGTSQNLDDYRGMIDPETACPGCSVTFPRHTSAHGASDDAKQPPIPALVRIGASVGLSDLQQTRRERAHRSRALAVTPACLPHVQQIA